MVVFMDMKFSTTSVILVGAATIYLVTTIMLKHLGNFRRHLPPGPRAIPVIGHLHFLMDKTRPIHQILNSLSQLYGPIMQLKFGSSPVLVITSSDLAKECFTVNDKAFASRPRPAHGQHLGYNYYNLGWAPYGPYWRNARKICVLELLSSKIIQSFRHKRMKEICKAVYSMFQQSQLQSIVNMRNVLSQLTFKTLMAMIIDDRYFGEELGIPADLFTHLIEETLILKGVICIGDYIPWLKWFDLQGHEKAMKEVQGKLDLYLQRILDKHREKGLQEERVMEDFIDVLISQAKENSEAIPDKDAFIKATALVMLSAGTDTSSVALEWALSMLLQHPKVMNKAQEELDSKVERNRLVMESDIHQLLKYLQAIVKETLRLHPLAPLPVPHKSIEDCRVGGYHFPAGTMLMVNAWAIHRDSKAWNKPLEFMPERFMEKEIEIDNIMSGNDFEMIPFGAGRRGCPGASLANVYGTNNSCKVVTEL
ncbi:hypothetical protein SUGI_1118150 [Cryptomeria japonica]|uniref:cytochrome P450 81E8-like n=1 Tax=Cryptomeria japonica TaxID=3369 RepID=UPI002414A7D6|nr:cytochrome P450 81E8-like [Cryptomeria japonica]GLJ52545.1 hypothetical protein SUGI_1118150 [Cryptomeria japonica]